MKSTELDIRGMSCGNCVRHVEKALLSVPGVQSVQVSLEAGKATVLHDADLDLGSLVRAVDDEGYEASLPTVGGV